MDRPDPNEPSAAPGPAAGSPPPAGSDAAAELVFTAAWLPAARLPARPAYPPPAIPATRVPATRLPTIVRVVPAGATAGYPPTLPPGRDGPFLDVPGVPPATRGAAGVWFLFALIGFVGGEIVALIATAIAAAVAGQGGQLSKIAALAQPPEWYVGASLIGLWVGFLGGPWLASRARGTGRFLADLGVRFRWIDLVGIFIGIGGQILVGLLYPRSGAT